MPNIKRELPDTDGVGRKASFIDPDAPLPGPGRESLRVMAYNVLSEAQMRRKARKGELEEYLDEMADAVDSEAGRFIRQGYDSTRAWSLAIRQVIHGKEPD